MKNTNPDDPKMNWLEMAKAVLYLVGKHKRKYLFLNLIVLLSFFYDQVPPFVIGKIVDFFTAYSVGQSLMPFYLMTLFLVVASAVLSILRLTSKNEIGKIISQVVYETRVKGFEKLVDFSIKWHDNENTGNKVQRIQNGTGTLFQMQRVVGNDVFIQFSTIIGVLIGYLILKPSFFLYSLIYLSIFIGIQALFYRQYQKLNNEFNSQMEKASGTYYEGLSNVLTIKTLGVKDDFKKNVSTKEELSRDSTVKMIKLGTDKWKYFQIINSLFLGGVILLSGYSYLNNAITLGSIFVFTTYFFRLSTSIGQSTNLIDQMVGFKISIARMMPIFYETSSIKEGDLSWPRNWENISIKKGDFKYDPENKISDLKNIKIQIERNEKIGIVGKSGSGKSTFAKILLALYEINGDYKIGDRSVYEIKHEELTKNAALVLQDSEMFNLSLSDNITLMRKMDTNLFEQAIEVSQLKDFIKKLPDGLDTLIGEKGYRLSGGERQRIGIARAIYRDPQILVLDEATSSLDSLTEAKIQNSLIKILKEKTVISIAHRISTLKDTDRILVFQDGKIIEEGKFNELEANKESEFYKLYNSQSKSNT